MVKDTHVTLLKLAVDGFSLTFGQSQKELLYMIENKMYKLYKFDHVQMMVKKKIFLKQEVKQFGPGPLEEQMTSAQPLRGKLVLWAKCLSSFRPVEYGSGAQRLLKKTRGQGEEASENQNAKPARKEGKSVLSSE